MITLDDDYVLKTVAVLFGTSEPGAKLHHLVLVREERTALGLPEPRLYVYAIAPTFADARESERFTARTVLAASHDPEFPEPPLLAALTMEMVTVPEEVQQDEAVANRARVLHAAGHLDDHPLAVEVTRLYAAAPDGRRWTGMHWLTGPQAGEVDGPTLRARGTRTEMDGWPFAKLIRHSVGLLW